MTDDAINEFSGATVGRLMKFDQDHLRIGLMAAGPDRALLAVHLRSHPGDDGTYPVVEGDELTVGPYHVVVVTAGPTSVAVRVTRPANPESPVPAPVLS